MIDYNILQTKMNFVFREMLFFIMLLLSFAISCVFHMYGNFRYKKELLSSVGILQMVYFCGWDTLHLLILIFVGTTVIKATTCGPRVVFVCSVFHRFFFSSSKYLGFPRDESNLANAGMLVATLKMVVVAYEIADYRSKKKGEVDLKQSKYKWLNLDHEPSAYNIFCFMTSFVALFTGPIFRYKTYSDMLYKYVDIPIREQIMPRIKACILFGILFLLMPYNIVAIKDGSFHKHSYFMRLTLMSVVAMSHGLKYTIGWLIAECTCILIGLGGYPTSCNAIPGQGPCCKPTKKDETAEEKKFDFNTISTIKFVETLASPTVKAAAQTWNHCTQWWLGYFVYAGSLLPRGWKIARVSLVMLMSAALHGMKAGYFMSFPVLVVCLVGEEIFYQKFVDSITSNNLLILFKVIYWLFFKTLVLFFLINVFLLQSYNEVLKFCKSMKFYGYVMPFIFLTFALLFRLVSRLRT